MAFKSLSRMQFVVHIPSGSLCRILRLGKTQDGPYTLLVFNSTRIIKSQRGDIREASKQEIPSNKPVRRADLADIMEDRLDRQEEQEHGFEEGSVYGFMQYKIAHQKV